SLYYNVFLNYSLNLNDTDGHEILDCEGFELLETIERLRSIVAAAEEMKMSYRKAWGIIQKVENKLGFPLVLKHRGGAEGGYTTLSEEGTQLLNAYRELTTQFDGSIKEIARKFFRKINR
ncbi:MAG: winged helix-turn-helix domain-containing protein, partial [Bacteroidales bacterium]